MPTTKKEKIIFGLMMCVGMVLGMTMYNLIVNDLIGVISLQGMLLQFAMGFVIAFLLESFIVGPLAHKVAFSLPFDKSKRLPAILVLSCCMVVGMVLFMSVFGLVSSYAANGLDGSSWLSSYGTITLKNFIFALPLQLLIVGPIVHFAFRKYIQGEPAVQASQAG
ncbi:hypothetical protein CHH69_17260 [Terribacillus saccharophilus]|uniref:hypothetical protein n=1 Tax=Terribacillus saccharophilus TaxID=361277 RepID=UPI000BA75CCC|nr:hypothetical protein [Terribacillus saccharophilus]PAF23127.1 hypothetical protein CHH49_00775 [Terribacillus saccharophilus]PAF34162.1 hypothetical protein CHH69_17260 [Terribacillus saccharophilus]